jgi:hypothetical protein
VRSRVRVTAGPFLTHSPFFRTLGILFLNNEVSYELVYDVSRSSLLVEDLGSSLKAYHRLLRKSLIQEEPSLALHSFDFQIQIEQISYNSPLKILAHPYTSNILALIGIASSIITPFVFYYLENTTPLQNETEASIQSKRDFIKPLVNSGHNSSMRFSVIDKSTNTVINNIVLNHSDAEQMDENLRKAKSLLEKEDNNKHERMLLKIENLANVDVKADKKTKTKGIIYELSNDSKNLIFIHKEDSDYIRSVPVKETIFVVDISIIRRGSEPALYKIHTLHKELTQFID